MHGGNRGYPRQAGAGPGSAEAGWGNIGAIRSSQKPAALSKGFRLGQVGVAHAYLFGLDATPVPFGLERGFESESL